MSVLNSVGAETTRTSLNTDRNSGKEMIKLKNISKLYHGSGTNNGNGGSSNIVLLEHIVLDNISLRVIAGEFVTIVGP